MTKRVHRDAAGAVQIAVTRLADQPASLTFDKGDFSPAIGLHDRTVSGIIGGCSVRFKGMTRHRLIWLLCWLSGSRIEADTGPKRQTTNPSIDSAGGYA